MVIAPVLNPPHSENMVEENPLWWYFPHSEPRGLRAVQKTLREAQLDILKHLVSLRGKQIITLKRLTFSIELYYASLQPSMSKQLSFQSPQLFYSKSTVVHRKEEASCPCLVREFEKLWRTRSGASSWPMSKYLGVFNGKRKDDCPSVYAHGHAWVNMGVFAHVGEITQASNVCFWCFLQSALHCAVLKTT